MLPDKILISGIGTGVGKTLVSAAMCNRFGYDYWKPVQCGDLDNTDSHKVQALSKSSKVFEEAYKLEDPLSPHHAASNANLSIDRFAFPDSHQLIVEGAGGLMVPINETPFTYLDFANSYKLPVLLVSRNYLGSINHTLMSIEMLKQKGIELVGIVISGNVYPEGEMMYEKYGARIIGRLPELKTESDCIESFEWYGLD